MSVLLDSDVVIEVLRARDQGILSLWSTLAGSGTPILVSPVTIAEIWAGARASEHPAISRFFGPLTCAPADHVTGQLAGEILRKYSKSHGVEIADALIAAAAVQHKAALWTRNRKHYPTEGLTFYFVRQ